MSIPKKHTITCPKCGTSGDFTAWDSINVDLMPEMKEKVMSGEIFRWTCPHCGETFTVPYPILYHDMSKQIMVYHLLQRGNPSDMKAVNILGKNGLMANYTLRCAYSIDDFREKIAQLESGLDDRVLEMLKYYFLHHNPQSELPEDAVLRFDRAAENKETGEIVLLFFLIHPSYPKQPYIQVPSFAYHEMEKTGNLDAIFGGQGTDYIEVSQDYIKKVLQKE